MNIPTLNAGASLYAASSSNEFSKALIPSPRGGAQTVSPQAVECIALAVLIGLSNPVLGAAVGVLCEL